MQQIRKVSVSSTVTDGSLSDEASPIGRKKIVAKRRGSAGKLQRSSSSVDEASQKSTQPEKRDRNAREKADSVLIGKENTAPNSPVKKKPVGRSSERVRTILGTHNV